MEKIGVVICNYNKEYDVLQCIQSVVESKFTDYHIYVVDNASVDHSVEWIKRDYGNHPKVTLLMNEENLGGSGGFNRGLREALAKGHTYLMCMDNDAMIDENCLGILAEHLDTNPQTGIAAAKIYHTGQEDYVQQYGSFIDWENYAVNSTYLNCLEDGTHPEVVYSDAVPACALMIRRSVVEQIGVMPEENFLYWDDTEWCIRCIEAGYKVASIGAAMACHAMGAKKESVNTFPTYYAWRNWIVFFAKRIPEAQLEDMAKTFLGSIFEIAYSGLYRGEENRTKTVMAAMDDALHGVMGKAGEDRIFPLEGTYDGLEKVLQGKRHLYLEIAEFPLFAENLVECLAQAYPDLRVTCDSQGPKPADCDLVISLCESIFWQEDLSLQKVYMDLDENVLATEEDVLRVINYPYSRQNFIFAQKPMFIRLTRELRSKD